MDIDKDAIKAKLAAFLKIPANRIDGSMALKGIVPDSFMLVELLIELQEEYGVRLIQADVDGIDTVSDLTEMIAARVNATTFAGMPISAPAL